jgi:DNA-binding response OmpR family regulator
MQTGLGMGCSSYFSYGNGSIPKKPQRKLKKSRFLRAGVIKFKKHKGGIAMFRILVAEDDDNARFLMCEVLRRAGYEPCPARDGVEALEVMEHYQCDLAVVDITMPRMDGITFTQTLREGNCDLPVLMVTARVTQEDKRRGFRAGTDDYMVKPVDEEEMLWRIEALLRRYCSRADRRLTVGTTVLDRGSLQVITPQSTWQLSAKEFLLLYKLLSYPRTLFTKRQLIDDIWDLDSDVDEHTVEVYISRLREKFRDNPDFELRTIRGFGYMGMPREDGNGQK